MVPDLTMVQLTIFQLYSDMKVIRILETVHRNFEFGSSPGLLMWGQILSHDASRALSVVPSWPRDKGKHPVGWQPSCPQHCRSVFHFQYSIQSITWDSQHFIISRLSIRRFFQLRATQVFWAHLRSAELRYDVQEVRCSKGIFNLNNIFNLQWVYHDVTP